MRAPPRPFDLTEFVAAAWTFESFAPEHPGEIHIAAAFAFGIDVVLIGAAALLDRQVHDGT